MRGAIGMAKAYLRICPADRATAEERYAICQTCQNNDLGQCRRCGCFVAAKIRDLSQFCPEGRWHKVVERQVDSKIICEFDDHAEPS